jgi:hypothetical protein
MIINDGGVMVNFCSALSNVALPTFSSFFTRSVVSGLLGRETKHPGLIVT